MSLDRQVELQTFDHLVSEDIFLDEISAVPILKMRDINEKTSKY